MQDRIFDVIDLNAEIEKARNTLEQADIAFQRHATKFDNTDSCEDLSSKKFLNMDISSEKQAPKSIKFIKIPNVDIVPYLPQPTRARQDRTMLIDTNDISDPLKTVALLPLKRKFSTKKKTVTF
ncbi:uncharacterized protein LOC143423900 [Xylocopa sonorina]|uniref:uncharacterized protein LOC143423900 n=1 Tax=Xylocopa sonorina TaxID=1818115 RepID=UPI00403AE939